MTKKQSELYALGVKFINWMSLEDQERVIKYENLGSHGLSG